MVQLPATAAIEHVVWRGHFFPGVFWPGGFLSGSAFVRGVFCPGDCFPGGLLPGGTFGRGNFWIFVRGCFCPGGLCPFPQVQCVYTPSRLSVPSIVAWRTKKTRKLCYRKDDRAMRPIGALNICGTPWPRPRHYAQHFHGLLFQSTRWMFLQNLKRGGVYSPRS